MKIDGKIEIEEYNEGTYAFRLTILDPIFSDGYDFLISHFYTDKEECMKDGRKFVDDFNREAMENAAIRELMNCYNVGGWTDSIEPMKRALKAEAELADLRERLRLVEEVYKKHEVWAREWLSTAPVSSRSRMLEFWQAICKAMEGK